MSKTIYALSLRFAKLLSQHPFDFPICLVISISKYYLSKCKLFQFTAPNGVAIATWARPNLAST